MLMDHLPPLGWADIVTKDDLRGLQRPLERRIDGMEQRLDQRIDELEQRTDLKLQGLEHRVLSTSTVSW